MSVPSNARTATSARAWRTERAAIKDAAFQAYKNLYQCGLLTQHLLPIDNRPNIEDDLKKKRLDFHHLGQRLCVWGQMQTEAGPNYLYRTSVAICNTITGWRSAALAIWAFNDLSDVGAFELFAEDEQTLVVECHHSVRVVLRGAEELNTLWHCTHTMIIAARSKVVLDLETNLLVFITPDLALDELRLWLQQHQGEMPAGEFYDKRGTNVQGLVSNTANGNSLHIFRSWRHIEVEEGNYMLEIGCSPFPVRRNFLNFKSGHSRSAWDTTEEEDAIAKITFYDAQDCLIRLQPLEYAWMMRFVPSIFYHLESFLVGKRLQHDILPGVAFRSYSNIISSITSPATQLQDNYERLEFLGDSLLKFHTTQQMYRDYPQWHEEYLTRQRNNIVSNISLAEAAVAKGIDKFIVHEPFDAKNWTVPSAKSIERQSCAPRHLRMKVVADVMEALIGAAFLGGGMDSARRCMSTLLPDVRDEVGVDKITVELSHSDRVADSRNLPRHAERVVGHFFASKYLLLEALTHPSCTRDAATEPYQRLEFLGDAVLDFIVIKDLFNMLPHGSHSLLTKIKSAVVNGDFLAFLCYSTNEVVEGITYSGSPKEPSTRHMVKKRQGLWMMMRYGADAIADARQQGVERFDNLREQIDNVFLSGKEYPWEELFMLRAPKFISDVVESVLGAIFVDTDGDLEVCREFLEKIGLMGHLRRIVARRMNVTHPKERLNRLLCGRKMKHIWGCVASGSDGLSLSVLVDDAVIASISGCFSKDEAIIRATNVACKYLEGESS